MRRVNIPPEPASLKSVKVELERAAVAAFYAIPANGNQSYNRSFSAYKAADIKKCLTQAFCAKCAYCESSFEATHPLEVEHFRPKSAVEIDGALRPPGYHWLASHWENLLPSCIDCNRRRSQTLAGSATPRTVGKGNKFPISGAECDRARVAGDEVHERPLLLHPYFDDPDEHLEYIWNVPPTSPELGEVHPRRRGAGTSRKGQASIEVYALQRIGLVRHRGERLTLLRAQLLHLDEVGEDLRADHENVALKARFVRVATEIRDNFLAPKSEYSAMCWQVVRARYPQLFSGR